MDRRLDLEMKTLQIQYNMVKSELESVKKMVDNISKNDFRYAWEKKKKKN